MIPQTRKGWRILLLLLLIVGGGGAGVGVLYRAVVKEFSGYTDRLYQVDHSWSCYEYGTALRVPRAGLFGGKVRYYVIVLRDRMGHTVETLYEGPGGFPDAPIRPWFVALTGDRVMYELEDGSLRVFTPSISSNLNCQGGDAKQDVTQ